MSSHEQFGAWLLALPQTEILTKELLNTLATKPKNELSKEQLEHWTSLKKEFAKTAFKKPEQVINDVEFPSDKTDEGMKVFYFAFTAANSHLKAKDRFFHASDRWRKYIAPSYNLLYQIIYMRW